MSEFNCDKCGLCCQNLNENELYSDLNDGTGVCKFFDKVTKLCKIYDERPLKCNVKKGYQLYEDIMDYDEYVKLNYEICKKLKEGI